MKTRIPICLLIITLLVFLYKSCPYRFSCDGVENINLGKIDFSSDLRNSNFERNQYKIIFKNDDKELVFKRGGYDEKTIHYNAYKICQKIHIEPIYKKYAYYEYEDLKGLFSADSARLEIRPRINEHSKNSRIESLSINFSFYGVGHAYGSVPFYNINEERAYIFPHEIFKHHDQIELGEDIEFKDIWVFKQQNLGIYYSKKSGVVALEVNGKILLRNRVISEVSI